MIKSYLTLGIFLCGSLVMAQKMTLEELIVTAKQSNTALALARQSVETQKEQLEGSKKNILPHVDLLAGYNYLGKPVEINVEQARESIVEGTATQSANTAGIVYERITGKPLNSDIQNLIYQTSRDIISSIYPNNNIQLAKQDYFLAGLFVRQPLYLGGKLKAVQELHRQQLASSEVNLESVEDFVAYNVSLQYIQVMYLNAMIEKEKEKVEALRRNRDYADNLLKAEIIPSYQSEWADVAMLQGQTSLENLEMEKENTLLTLKKMIGMRDDAALEVSAMMPHDYLSLDLADSEGMTDNADVRLLESKKEEANVALRVAKSLNYPNIFAVGNLQFMRKDLPIVTPPWMVGVEMQWTIFDGWKSRNQIKAAESLVRETELLIQQKEESVTLAKKVAFNKVRALQKQSQSLDVARKKTYNTTDKIRKRMENGLSSVKDVNDALKFQYEAEKLYYTSVAAYQTALATFFYLNGNPERFSTIINETKDE